MVSLQKLIILQVERSRVKQKLRRFIIDQLVDLLQSFIFLQILFDVPRPNAIVGDWIDV